MSPHSPQFEQPSDNAPKNECETLVFIHDHSLHGSVARLRYTVGHGMRNHGQCLILRMRHHRVDSLLDHIAAEADAANIGGQIGLWRNKNKRYKLSKT